MCKLRVKRLINRREALKRRKQIKSLRLAEKVGFDC